MSIVALTLAGCSPQDVKPESSGVTFKTDQVADLLCGNHDGIADDQERNRLNTLRDADSDGVLFGVDTFHARSKDFFYDNDSRKERRILESVYESPSAMQRDFGNAVMRCSVSVFRFDLKTNRMHMFTTSTPGKNMEEQPLSESLDFDHLYELSQEANRVAAQAFEAEDKVGTLQREAYKQGKDVEDPNFDQYVSDMDTAQQARYTTEHAIAEYLRQFGGKTCG